MFTVTTLVWLGYCYSVGVATVRALAWLGYCYSVGMVTVSLLQNWRGYCHSVGVVTVTALVRSLLQRWCWNLEMEPFSLDRRAEVQGDRPSHVCHGNDAVSPSPGLSCVSL